MSDLEKSSDTSCLEEGFLEKVDDFSCGLSEINERFEDRLSGKVIRFAEDYRSGRLGFVLYLHRRGQSDCKWVALCLDCRASALSESAVVRANKNKVLVKGDSIGSKKQHSVLVDVVEFVETPDGLAIPSKARLYAVENEEIGVWEGLMYHGVSASGFDGRRLKILPRFVSWKGYLRGFVGSAGSGQAGPKEVHNAVEVVNGVTKVHEERGGHDLVWADCDYRGLRVIVDSDNVNIVTSDLFDEVFDAVEVYFGPFDLEF
ncbi:MAG: hypothetical protein HEP70_00895 [Rhodobiaceae bacterium]|nr:hypothetical protein [Rhodobiaceae bacterium]